MKNTADRDRNTRVVVLRCIVAHAVSELCAMLGARELQAMAVN